jgi:hypothetical protein
MRISEMNKFLRKAFRFLIFFIGFSILINLLFLVLVASTDWDFIKRREFLKLQNADFNVVVLGTSLAEYGIDTELMTYNGLKSINLSFVGSTVKTNYIQLNEYLQKISKKPDYVILAVNSHLEEFDKEGIQPVVEFTMKGHKYGIKDLPISKFNWAGMELIKKLFRKQYRETYLSYGQKKCDYSEPDLTDFNDLSLDLEKYESSIWIGEIASLCANNNVELIVIEMPGENKTRNKTGIGPFKVKSPNGYHSTLYNFNNHHFCEFIDNDSDWAGLSHFNRFGAEKFTREIILRVFSKPSYSIHNIPSGLDYL